MSEPQSPQWLAWIVPGVAAMTAIFTAARRLLITVTRDELLQLLKEQEEAREERRQALHEENLENFRNLYDRLGKVEQSQARTEGMLSGRFPRIER